MITAAEHQRYEDDMADLDSMREHEAGEIVEAIEDGRSSLDAVIDFMLEGDTDAVGAMFSAMDALVKARTDSEQLYAAKLVRKSLIDAAWDFGYSQAEDLTLDDLREKRREI